MCNFIKSNEEQCKLARNKERCGKHPIITDEEEIIVAESNIEIVEMQPHVNTPVVAEVDMPAPSVIKPVEASNVEVSKVPELDESNVAPVVTDSAVYGEEYNSNEIIQMTNMTLTMRMILSQFGQFQRRRLHSSVQLFKFLRLLKSLISVMMTAVMITVTMIA